MALFGTPNSYVGIDIGTSSLKMVELTSRRRRVEVTAYAQADFPNPLVAQTIDDDTIKKTTKAIQQMIQEAGIASDAAVVALPTSAVFSSVIKLPRIPDNELEKAIEFAARDVVPADLDEVVLGYSRLGERPHMETDNDPDGQGEQPEKKSPAPTPKSTAPDKPIPVFVTAVPKYVVSRYSQVIDELKLNLVALELETFPMVRSLLSGDTPSGIIVDIGDRATTFHIIDAGTPRVSYTIEFGGHHITQALADAQNISFVDAESMKAKQGVLPTAPEDVRKALESATTRQITKAQNLLDVYKKQEGRAVNQTVLIGGGANLPGLADFWGKASGQKTMVGNPWRGLSYPNTLGERLQHLGPTYGVAVGLALRGFTRER